MNDTIITTRIQRKLGLSRTQGLLGRSSDGKIYAPNGKYYVRARTSTNEYLDTEAYLGGINLQMKPGNPLVLELDENDDYWIVRADVRAQIAAGYNTYQDNALDPSHEVVRQDAILTGYSHQTKTPSTRIYVKGWIFFVDGTGYYFPGGTINLSSSIPAAGLHRYVLIVVKQDLTLAAFASTSQSVNDPLDFTDVNEAWALAYANAKSNAPMWIWRLADGQTTITDTDRKIDVRQIINSQLTGGLSRAVVIDPDSTSRNLIQPGNASYFGLIIKGAASQSANLQEWRNSSDVSLGFVGPTGQAKHLILDAATTTVSNPLILSHDTSGTASTGFGTGLAFRAESSTTSDQDIGAINFDWTVATHASRTSRAKIRIVNSASLTDALTLEISGGNVVTTIIGPKITASAGSGKVLTSDGSGNGTWQTPVMTPGGSDTHVQYNDGGTLAGDANLIWNKTTKTLIVGNLSVTGETGQSTVINEAGLGVDFRVEGDTETHLLFVNGLSQRVMVNTNSFLDPIFGSAKVRIVDSSMEMTFGAQADSVQGWIGVSNGTIKGFVGHTSTQDGFVNGTFSDHNFTLRARSNANVFQVQASGKTMIAYRASAAAMPTANSQLHVLTDDAETSAITNVLTIGHNSSGTPAANYGTGIIVQAESSTTENRDLGRLRYLWTTATDASRASKGILSSYSTSTETDAIEWTPTDINLLLHVNITDAKNIALATGTGTKIGTSVSQKLGFWNATPIIQPAAASQAALTNSTGGSYDGTLAAISGTGDDATINNNFTDIYTLLTEIRTALVNTGIIKGAA